MDEIDHNSARALCARLCIRGLVSLRCKCMELLDERRALSLR